VTPRATCAVAAVLLASAAASAAARVEWALGPTGKGAARWTNRGERLIYRGGATLGWALVRGASVRDGFIQVRLKPVGGREDRAGGVVWRWRGPDSYYAARAHALAGNIVAFKVVKGRRVDLSPVQGSAGPEGARARVTSGQWHTLRVDFEGAEFRVSFDGRRLFSVRDDALGEAGAVGVWAKADSVTEFRGFEYRAR
jgi:hypothetical protein